MTLDQLHQELINLCTRIGRTTDLATLREQFITATALWARIERLTPEPQKTA
jgi:hypothetical protein